MSVEAGEQSASIASTKREGVERKAWLTSILEDASLLLLGSWIGASIFFSFVVAPSAFSILRDSTALYANHLAGTIVTRNLMVINIAGFTLGLLLLLSHFVLRKVKWRASVLVEVFALVILSVATGVGQWVIAARMLALRGQMGRPIDETAASDPLRVAFNNLHVYSVAALTVAMVAAFVAFVLIARRRREEMRG